MKNLKFKLLLWMQRISQLIEELTEQLHSEKH